MLPIFVVSASRDLFYTLCFLASIVLLGLFIPLQVHRKSSLSNLPLGQHNFSIYLDYRKRWSPLGSHAKGTPGSLCPDSYLANLVTCLEQSYSFPENTKESPLNLQNESSNPNFLHVLAYGVFLVFCVLPNYTNYTTSVPKIVHVFNLRVIAHGKFFRN